MRALQMEVVFLSLPFPVPGDWCCVWCDCVIVCVLIRLVVSDDDGMISVSDTISGQVLLYETAASLPVGVDRDRDRDQNRDQNQDRDTEEEEEEHKEDGDAADRSTREAKKVVVPPHVTSLSLGLMGTQPGATHLLHPLAHLLHPLGDWVWSGSGVCLVSVAGGC